MTNNDCGIGPYDGCGPDHVCGAVLNEERRIYLDTPEWRHKSSLEIPQPEARSDDREFVEIAGVPGGGTSRGVLRRIAFFAGIDHEGMVRALIHNSWSNTNITRELAYAVIAAAELA